MSDLGSHGRGGLVVAGGGTGGHVFAGIAVADEWRKEAAPGDILFVGARGRIEETLVPRAGYPLETLQLGSLKRVSLGRRLRTFYQLPWSLARSAAILSRRRPRAVLGVGGFASGPLVLMARLLRLVGLTKARTAILEQNSVPGFTNRLLGRLVDEVFCAFPGTEGQFPGRPVTVTGNPVRSVMARLPAAPRDPFAIFIFGGSQGALGVNTLVIEALAELRDLYTRMRFIHQTGEKDYERVRDAYRAAGLLNEGQGDGGGRGRARVDRFIHEMAAAYAQSSLLICRAGSSTLSEIAAVGRAAILVPLPTAADNHQEKNARVFSDAGAARLLTQAGAPGRLSALVRELVASADQTEGAIARMEREVTRFHRPDSARAIVERLARARGDA